MSLDIFFQQFVDGDAGPGGNAEARAVLEPYLIRDASGATTGLHTDDGEAEVFGLDDESGFVVTHASGDQVWNLLVSAARAGDLVVMPVGCPVCAPVAGLLTHLPGGTRRRHPGDHERRRAVARDHHGLTGWDTFVQLTPVAGAGRERVHGNLPMNKKVLALAAVCLTAGSMLSACSSSGSKSSSSSGATSSYAGGASSSATPSKVKLAYSQPATDPYQNAEQQGVIGQYKSLGYKYLPATNAGGSAAQQLTDVESLINQGAKGIVMSVLDANAIIPAIKYANSHHVPIVPIDEAPVGGKVAMIVRADNVNMGKLACEQMGKLVPAGKAVLTLDGDPISSNGRDRTNGFQRLYGRAIP